MKSRKNPMSPGQHAELLTTLQARFVKHMKRHKGLAWADVRARLETHVDKLEALQAMESTGGEPDVVGIDKKTGACLFMDCSAETPNGRRSLCYDRAGLESRKDHPPANTAVDLAAEMGVELLDEAMYRDLQQHGPFDTKTSSWLLTPTAIRHLGGALFGDHRYGQVFVYHNGAQSYYAARAFRAGLRV